MLEAFQNGSHSPVQCGALSDKECGGLSYDDAWNACSNQNWNHFHHLVGFLNLSHNAKHPW